MTDQRSTTETSEPKTPTVEEAEKIWTEAARRHGPIPKKLRVKYGVNADGTPAEGGITEEGRKGAAFLTSKTALADATENLVKTILGGLHGLRNGGGEGGSESDGEDEAEPDAHVHVGFGVLTGSPDGDRDEPYTKVAGLLSDLDLIGPIRAALRGAALGLAGALDDSADGDPAGDGPAGERAAGRQQLDGDGFPVVALGQLPAGYVSGRLDGAPHEDIMIGMPGGGRAVVPVLGPEPYIVIRFKEAAPGETHDGEPVGARLSIICGGVGMGEAGDDLISVRGLLTQAISSFMLAEEKGVNLNDAGVLVVGLHAHEDSAAGPSTEAPYGVPPQETPPAGPPVGDDDVPSDGAATPDGDPGGAGERQPG